MGKRNNWGGGKNRDYCQSTLILFERRLIKTVVKNEGYFHSILILLKRGLIMAVVKKSGYFHSILILWERGLIMAVVKKVDNCIITERRQRSSLYHRGKYPVSSRAEGVGGVGGGWKVRLFWCWYYCLEKRSMQKRNNSCCKKSSNMFYPLISDFEAKEAIAF